MTNPDKIEGFLEIGTNEKCEVVINLDHDRTGHINFSPRQARNLASLLFQKAGEIDPSPHDWRAEPQNPDSKEPPAVATLVMGAMSMRGMDEATAKQIVSNHYQAVTEELKSLMFAHAGDTSQTMRVEQCVRCQGYVSDWVDTEESRGRICRPCEHLDKARAEQKHLLDLYTQTAIALGMTENEDFDSLPALARTCLWELNAVIRFAVDVFLALDPNYREKLADLDWHVFDFVTSKWSARPAGSQTLLTLSFVARMERELHANQREGGWKEWRPTLGEARSEICHHAERLIFQLRVGESDERARTISEFSADLANIAMKIFDMFGYKQPTQIP